VLPIVQQLGLRVPEDVELVYETFSTAHVGHVPYPCVETSQPFEEIARQISLMLYRQRAGTELDNEHVRVPVKVRAASKL
jgi:DNA-binding LacI/PurR family transcriptional regulator